MYNQKYDNKFSAYYILNYSSLKQNTMSGLMFMIIGGIIIVLIILIGFEIYLHYDTYFLSRAV